MLSKYPIFWKFRIQARDATVKDAAVDNAKKPRKLNLENTGGTVPVMGLAVFGKSLVVIWTR